MAQRRRRKKSWISWLILVILLAGAVAMIVLVRNNLFGEKDEPAPVKETSIGEKKYPVEKKEEQDGQSKKDVVEKSEEGQKEEDSSLTGVVTYAGKIEDVLMIRVNIDQFLSEGTCTLNLEKDGEIVYGEMVEIIDSAATATCEGFNVPAHSFGAGNYKIVIKLKAGEQNGIINGEVSL